MPAEINEHHFRCTFHGTPLAYIQSIVLPRDAMQQQQHPFNGPFPGLPG